MSKVWKIINRKNISLDKRVLEAIAEKYDIPKDTRPEFVEELLICSQSVEQRQFLNKVLRLSGLYQVGMKAHSIMVRASLRLCVASCPSGSPLPLI